MASPEFKLQVACVKHLESAFPGLFYFHVGNESKNAQEAYWKKLMGTKAGCPDFLFMFLGGNGAIELKAESGRISNAQNRFLSSLANLGWRTAVCCSVRQMHEALKGWGLKPIHDVCVEPDLRTWDEKRNEAMEFYKHE